MLPIIVMMILIVTVAGLVLAYVAFPHRGHDMPGAPWLGDAMTKARKKVSSVEEEPGRQWSLRR